MTTQTDILFDLPLEDIAAAAYHKRRAMAKDRIAARKSEAIKDREFWNSSFFKTDPKRLQYRGSRHYSYGQDAVKLKQYAKAAALVLKRDFPKDGDRYPVLLYSGMSGISHATAISLQLERDGTPYGMLYVRKYKEKSNTYERAKGIETTLLMNTNKIPVLVLVDDLISSGKTMFWCYWRALKGESTVEPLYNGKYYVALAKSLLGGNLIGTINLDDIRAIRDRYFNSMKSISERIAV